jgi:DhnA family fructose-bisphosphate aldolase class Ia
MVEFIFMLTQDNQTVEDCVEVLELVADRGLRYVGFKDSGMTPWRQRELIECAHRLGIEVVLQIVTASHQAEVSALMSARAAGVDWVLGGRHPEAAIAVLGGTGIQYCPTPWAPSWPTGNDRRSISKIVDHAVKLGGLDGANGVTLMTYRHTDLDPGRLTRAVAGAVARPVIVAGGRITTQEQISMIARAGAWGFVIGHAIFKFSLAGGPTVPELVARFLEMAQTAGLRQHG